MKMIVRTSYFGILLLALGNACAADSTASPDDELTDPSDGGHPEPSTDPEDDALEPEEEGCIEISGSVKEPLVLKKRPVAPGSPDYCVDAPHSPLLVLAPVTVEPGVIIEMMNSAAVRVRSDGSLHAVGTEEAPILITGRHKAPGSWDGIRFESPSPDNVLNHVIVEYAGGDATFDRASITLGAGAGSISGQLALTHTVIRHGAAAGIVAYDGRFTEFSDNTITDHEGPPVLGYLSIVAGIDSSSRYSGNARDWVEVISSRTGADIVLAKLDVPYRFTKELEIDGRLEVSPGTTVLFTQDAGLIIRPDGALFAVGTETDPIVFDSVHGTPGTWKGIAISSLNPDNRLEHVVLANGGAPDHLCCSYSGVKALLIVGNSTVSPGKVVLDNVTITGSDAYGLYVFNNGSVVDNNVTYEENALGNHGL